MALAPYNRAPMNLADLLAMQTNSPDAPTGPPVASQPPSVDTGGVLTPQQRSSLLEQLLNPQQTTAVPADEQPQWGKKIAGSFADALNNIATIYAGGPDLRSNYLQEYLNGIERKNAERKSKAEKQAQQEAEGRTKKVEYLLMADEKARMRADDRAGRQALQDDAQAARKAIADQAAAGIAAERERRVAEAKDKMDLEIKLEKMRGGFQESVARINGNVDKTQARMDKKDLGDAITFIGKTALSAKAMLAGANGQQPMTPEQIMKTVDITLDGLTLTPEARKAADAYAAKELGTILHDYSIEQMYKGDGSGGPQPQSGFNLTNWMKAHGY